MVLSTPWLSVCFVHEEAAKLDDNVTAILKLSPSQQPTRRETASMDGHEAHCISAYVDLSYERHV